MSIIARILAPYCHNLRCTVCTDVSTSNTQ